MTCMAMDLFRGRSLGWAMKPRSPRAGHPDADTDDAADAPAVLALTEELPDTSSCPTCGRPLDALTGVCAGCGTRLVLGVQARRAAVFVAFGLLAGLLIGSVTMLLVTPRTVAEPVAAAAGSTDPGLAGSTASGTGASPTGAPGPVATIAPVPRDAANALRQVLAIDARLGATAVDLRRILAAKPFDAVGAARSLRDVAADASVGAQYPPGLAAWPAAASVENATAGFYDGVLTIARGGLSFSVADAAAYKSATVAMIVRFRALGSIDAAARSLATTAGIELAPATP